MNKVRELYSITNEKYFQITLKFRYGNPLPEDKRSSVRTYCPVNAMTSNEVLAMYETLASLTGTMSAAAQANDWDGLSRMENQCATVKSAAATGIPALDGAARQRKIALIKQIMANDRAIRACTEPWMNKVDALMSGAH